MQVASLLLLLCLGYDVFWVFLQPLFSGGQSVMVEVTPLLLAAVGEFLLLAALDCIHALLLLTAVLHLTLHSCACMS